MEYSDEIVAAFRRYLLNQHSEADFDLLRSYIDTDKEEELSALILNELSRNQTEEQAPAVRDVLAKTDQVIDSLIESELKPKRLLPAYIVTKARWAVAFAAMLLLALGISVYFHDFQQQTAESDEWVNHDIGPATNRALLTLEDGTVINLDGADAGILNDHDGLRITKDENGLVTYELMDKDQAVAGTRINTLSTPNGGQYRIILADGTKVRLNAATTLRYPKKFADDKREVEIDGEAYFEVAKDNERPFFVTSANQRIKVYGTEFNVNTYDVPGVVTTTLVEGSVEVYHTQGHFMLSPGQQTVSNAAGIKVLPVENMQQTIAWMKGEFYFDGAKIEDIMLQLERWYDIEVEYRTSVQHSFVAKIQRDVQLSEFLKILEMTGLVSFEIDGKKVVVLPKGK